ncbi:MAG: Gfo/Idh/MocA family oxidoreductase [Ruminococcaceae bacterium]|nr:Gfo/Idh/MocA family oxidoreductase [Oscillospiraceae bacterium]
MKGRDRLIDNKIKFAIIGCGMISNVHASAVMDIDRAELVGAWDLNSERCAAFCEKYRTRQIPSYEDLLKDSGIDAVCICSPSFCHKEQAIEALEHGKHVVVEKPMALTAADAKEICEVAEKNDRLLTVIFQTRFSKDILYLKSLLDDNAFGRLCFCDLYMKYYRDADYYGSSPWRGTVRCDGGGALMNQGIHGIDLIHYLVGDAKLIAGRAKTLVHDIETEDCAVAMLEYDCGALGVIEGSTCASPGFRRRLEINGERGYAVLSDTVLEKLCIDGKMIISKEIDPHPNTAKSPVLNDFSLHKAQIENFIAAINNEEALRVTPYDGYYTVKLIESIYRSKHNITEEN